MHEIMKIIYTKTRQAYAVKCMLYDTLPFITSACRVHRIASSYENVLPDEVLRTLLINKQSNIEETLKKLRYVVEMFLSSHNQI